VIQWSGVLAPAGVPEEVVSKLNAEINRVLARPDMRERFITGGADPGSGSPEQFGALIKSEIAKWSKVVKTIKIDVQR
jgi:tripartite-type tricarboxylate transporter receptor subunit TctC